MTQPKKSRVEVGNDSRAGHDKNKLNKSGIDSIEIDGGEVGNVEVEKKVQKTSKSKNLFKFKKSVESSDFFTPRAKLAFTKLRQAFLKTPILHHFDPKRYI